MALNLRGDHQLSRLIKMVESIGDPQSRAQLSQKMGREMLRLIDNSIQTSTDCYGHAMPPRVDDGAAPLQGLRGTFSAAFTAEGVKVGSSKWYAKVHNRGWRIKPKSAPYLRFRLPSGAWVSTHEVTIPRRQMMPSQATGGLGSVWGPALMRVANEFMLDYTRGR